MMTIVIITFLASIFANLGENESKVWRFLNIASTFRDIEVERASGGGFQLSADEKAEGEGEGKAGEAGKTRRERSEGGSDANSTTMVTFYGSESSIACRSRGERQ